MRPYSEVLKTAWTPKMAGANSLPVEILQDIFTMATDFRVDRYAINGGIEGSNLPFYTKIEELNHSLGAAYNESTLDTRYAITLVCKSWYFVGIPFLWSHIQVQYLSHRQIIPRLYRTLWFRPQLRPYIACLTVTLSSGEVHDENKGLDTKFITKVLPLLPNLKRFYCPLGLAMELPESLRIRISSIYADKTNFLFDYSWSTTVFGTAAFWHYCQTLSLSITNLGSSAIISAPQVILPNVTTMRLRISDKNCFDWIKRYWCLPNLKNLSIAAPPQRNWIQFLIRWCLTLEVLHCATGIQILVGHEDINMPNLKEIHATIPRCKRRRHGSLNNLSYGYIRAPGLEKYFIYLECPDTACGILDNLCNTIEMTLIRHSSIIWITVVLEEEFSRMLLKASYLSSSLHKRVLEWCDPGRHVEFMTVKGVVLKSHGKRYQEE